MTCAYCGQSVTAETGFIDGNVALCDNHLLYEEVSQEIDTAASDPFVRRAISAKLALAARDRTQSRKAAEKNGTIHLSDKIDRAEASAITRKERKWRQNERLLQMGDNRYRCRATYGATFELAMARLLDTDVPLSGDALPIYQPDVLPEEDNLAEIGEIIGISDVAGLTIYDSIGTYAREAFDLAG